MEKEWKIRKGVNRKKRKTEKRRQLRLILMQSEKWIEKAGFRLETKSGFLILLKKSFSDPNFFD